MRIIKRTELIDELITICNEQQNIQIHYENERMGVLRYYFIPENVEIIDDTCSIVYEHLLITLLLPEDIEFDEIERCYIIDYNETQVYIYIE